MTGSVDGYISFDSKIKAENNLFINNHVSSEVNENGWDFRGGVRLNAYNAPHPPQAFINNTVAFNRMEKPPKPTETQKWRESTTYLLSLVKTHQTRPSSHFLFFLPTNSTKLIRPGR